MALNFDLIKKIELDYLKLRKQGNHQKAYLMLRNLFSNPGPYEKHWASQIKNEDIAIDLMKINPSFFSMLPPRLRMKESVMMEAVKNDWMNLKYVQAKQTEELCWTALNQDENAIEYILKPTIEMCIFAVEKKMMLAMCIKKTPEIVDALMRANPRVIEYISREFHTDEYRLMAVKEDGCLLQWFDSQNAEICQAAVLQNPEALEFVKKQSQKICLMAIEQDGYALQYVKKQTPKICLAAVRKEGCALRYVEEQTLCLCQEAVKQNPRAIEFAKFQTPEMCMEVLERYPEGERYFNL